jgi:hypothetical protein
LICDRGCRHSGGGASRAGLLVPYGVDREVVRVAAGPEELLAAYRLAGRGTAGGERSTIRDARPVLLLTRDEAVRLPLVSPHLIDTPADMSAARGGEPALEPVGIER